MAENNSSAPLKTVPMIEAFEAAYSRDWNDPAGNEIKEIWHRAWQEAVAAQAAPADPMDWPLPCDVKVGSGTMCKGVPLRTLVLRMQMLHEWAAPSAGAVPPSMPSLSGDAALAYEQCRAVVHLALAVAEVYSSNALIVARDSRLADQIGAASAEVMEYLGDTLNSTDATTEDDEWLEPIFEGAQERWPAAKPPTLAASDRPQVPGHIGQLIDAYGASRADEDGQSGTRIGELVSALRDWAASLTTPALPATDSSAGDLAEVPDGFGSAEHWKEKAQYWAGVAHELRGQALRGEPVDGIIQPTSQAVVQAEPVAWMRKTDITELTDSEPETDGWTPLYAAPQAQPADALELAKKFHEVYERLAPNFGYETRSDTKQFDPSSPNGRLMTSVIQEVMTALGSDTQVDPIRQFIHKHAALVAENESAYFELCYHRATGWMAWITDRPLCMPPVINPGRKVIAQGQGDSAEEACSDAMAAAQEGGKA